MIKPCEFFCMVLSLFYLPEIISIYFNGLNRQLFFSQEQRLADHNNIGRLVFNGTFKIKNKISKHTEYH